MRGVRELLSRCREQSVRYAVLERLSGVSRFTFCRWDRRTPQLEQLVAVVETMGGKVTIEFPEKAARWCHECGEKTQTLHRGKREYCGGCGAERRS